MDSNISEQEMIILKEFKELKNIVSDEYQL